MEKNAYRSPNSVIALSALALAVRNGHFRDARAGRACQCRDEPVQLAVQLNLLDDLAPVRLEGRAKVVQLEPGELGHHPVPPPPRPLPHQPHLAPPPTPT